MKRVMIVLITLFGILLLMSCTTLDGEGEIHNIGFLTENSSSSQPWEEKGYHSVNAIGKKYDVDVYTKENIQTDQEVITAVDEFSKDGVNLIFGHSNIYGRIFSEISADYPNIHFVYFNGAYSAKNVTSLNFNAHAMGFFGGMVASRMTETGHIGIVAAYEWQPEIEGFFEGVKYENPLSEVHIEYINDWNKDEEALDMYKRLKEKGIDVVYPTGDSFSARIIERARIDNIYSIGYVSDQSNIGQSMVLTSTVQHVDQLYKYAAQQFSTNSLEGDIISFDFQDHAISLGEFSNDVSTEFQTEINELVDKYIETGLLPHEQ